MGEHSISTMQQLFLSDIADNVNLNRKMAAIAGLAVLVTGANVATPLFPLLLANVDPRGHPLLDLDPVLVELLQPCRSSVFLQIFGLIRNNTAKDFLALLAQIFESSEDPQVGALCIWLLGFSVAHLSSYLLERNTVEGNRAREGRLLYDRLAPESLIKKLWDICTTVGRMGSRNESIYLISMHMKDSKKHVAVGWAFEIIGSSVPQCDLPLSLLSQLVDVADVQLQVRL